MPRLRELQIRETIEELTNTEQELRGKQEAARVTALRVLLQEPQRSLAEVAALVGYSDTTVKRWLRVYRESGLQGLLQLKPGGRDDGAIDAGLARLKQKLMAGEFAGIEDAFAWLGQYRRSSGTRRLAQEAVRMSDDSRASDRAAKSAKGAAPGVVSESIAERFVAFLSDLPLEGDGRQWMERLGKFVESSYADVKKATIAVNMGYAQGEDAGTVGLMYVAEHVQGNERSFEPARPGEYRREELHINRTLAMLSTSNFPRENYGPPRGFVYYSRGDQQYVGSIILWPDRSKPPISAETLTAFEQLRPLLVFLFTDFAARIQALRPEQQVFNRVVARAEQDFDLTQQELRVLQLQIAGLMYKEIAEALNVSLNTVRTHVQSIYAKSGFHSPVDFVGYYFVPSVPTAKGKRPERRRVYARRNKQK